MFTYVIIIRRLFVYAINTNTLAMSNKSIKKTNLLKSWLQVSAPTVRIVTILCIYLGHSKYLNQSMILRYASRYSHLCKLAQNLLCAETSVPANGGRCYAFY